MRIAIITGGESGERDVSIVSAGNVALSIPFAEHETFVFPEEKDKFLAKASEFDLVIPVIHGKGGEDGEVQQLCESINLPFLFSPVEAHKIAIDKVLAKSLVERIGIRTPKQFSLSNAVFPVFVKPRFGGSSVSTSRVESFVELQRILAVSTEDMLIEEAVTGREFTVGVIEQNPGDPEALPVIEIRPKNGFFDFESKYDANQLAEEICPADIDFSLASRLQLVAVAIHVLIGASHLTRSDFLVNDAGEIIFLEINTIPGLTGTSLIPIALDYENIHFPGLLEKWCKGLLMIE